MSLLTIHETAAELKMSDRFVRDEIRRKRLRASKIGWEWRVDTGDLATYIAANANVRPVKRPA